MRMRVIAPFPFVKVFGDLQFADESAAQAGRNPGRGGLSHQTHCKFSNLFRTGNISYEKKQVHLRSKFLEGAGLRFRAWYKKVIAPGIC